MTDDDYTVSRREHIFPSTFCTQCWDIFKADTHEQCPECRVVAMHYAGKTEDGRLIFRPDTKNESLKQEPQRRAIKARYSDPKHKEKWIKVDRSGRCVLCPVTYALTRHHIFGNSQGLTVTLCHNCHHMVHAEIKGGMVGPFGRHVLQLLARVFPVTAELPVMGAENA